MKSEPNPNIRLKTLGFPFPVHVRMDRERYPVEVRHSGRFGSGQQRSGGKVISIHEIWRIDDEWWRQPISRLYYQVILENGKMMTLYQDLTSGSWYAQ